MWVAAIFIGAIIGSLAAIVVTWLFEPKTPK